MIAKKKCAVMFTVFMFLTSLAMVSVPVQSQSPPTFYVAGGPISGKPVGTTFWVDILVNASDLTYNSADAIAGWATYVQVDPTILKPIRVRTATAGYFLYDFVDYGWTTYTYFYDYPSVLSNIHPDTGLVDVTEMIAPTPPGGAATDGILPAPYLLISIQYESLSLYGNTTIDIVNPEYKDTNNIWYTVADGDGLYQGIPMIHIEADLVAKKAWPEHHHFDRSKSGDPTVPDSHGTPGYQTLYAKVQNTGDLNITVRAVFRLMKDGEVEPAILSNEVTIDPGEKVIVAGNARMFTVADDGKWSVLAFCEYYSPYSEVWVTGKTTKTTAFNVVA